MWRELYASALPTWMPATPPRPVPLSSRTATAELAWACTAVVSLAGSPRAVHSPAPALDPERIAVSYASERHLRIDGSAPPVWAPLSGFFRSSDGWVRTHANYPHHASALRTALALDPDADKDAAARALSSRSAAESVQAITAAGGLCVAVSRERPALDEALRATPLVHTAHIGSAPARRRTGADPDAPLRGIRVLDLTRVIAGPVATRTLALLGAEVLRIDPPALPEPEWQHLDSGHGKRSALLDVRRAPELFERLLSRADVVVTGYRPRAIAHLGLDPAALALRFPGLVVARLSAWGFESPDRRGFDSLVQAESGIAWLESLDGETPGALPAQALDHSAGHLLAAGTLTALQRQSAEGGTWLVETSLRRIAAELLGLPRTEHRSPPPAYDPAPHLQHFELDGLTLTTAAPAVTVDGRPTRFQPPRRWGRDPAAWL